MAEQEVPEVVADEPLLPPDVDPFADPAAGPRRTHTQPAHTAETAEQRRKRCPFHKVCSCDHTECTDGWLDEWVTIDKNDREYPAVVRCPRCEDAMVMTGELSAMRGKRKH